MVEKISMSEIKKELNFLRDYEKIKESRNKEELKDVKSIYKKYCDVMHSADILTYLRFYVLYICSAPKNYVSKVFGWNFEMVEKIENEIYNHSYNELNKN